MLIDSSPTVLAERTQAILSERQRLGEIIGQLQHDAHDTREQGLIEHVATARQRFIEGQEHFFALLRAEDRANARQMMDSELEPQLGVYFDAVDAYIDDQSTRAQTSANLARHTVLTSQQSMVGAAQLHGRAAQLHHDGGIFQLSAAIDRQGVASCLFARESYC